MATTKSWTDQQDAELVALHGQGLTQAECGRRLGISNRRVSEHSKVIGLAWDRSKTKAATSARVADNKAMRAALESRFLVKADRFLDRTEKPHVVWAFTVGDGSFHKHTLAEPPPSAVRDLTSSAVAATNASLKIAVHDSDSSHDDAKSMLTGLAAALGVAFRTPPEGELASD